MAGAACVAAVGFASVGVATVGAAVFGASPFASLSTSATYAKPRGDDDSTRGDDGTPPMLHASEHVSVCDSLGGPPRGTPDKVFFLTATEKEVEIMQGLRREVLVFNNEIQGPTHRAQLGDVVEVHVQNAMNNHPLSLHHHGLHQACTPYWDGAAMVSAPPLPTGSSQTSKFYAHPRGTHWYHSHSAMQYADGLRGLFIVEDPDDPFDKYSDTEHVLMIYDMLASQTSEEYMLSKFADDDFTNSEVQDSTSSDTFYFVTLVNGQSSLDNAYVASYGYDADATTGGAYNVTLAAGHTTRLRCASAAWNAQHSMRIVDAHTGEKQTFTVIASDGAYLKPVQVQELWIRAAERYDVLFTASLENYPGHAVCAVLQAPRGCAYVISYEEYGHATNTYKNTGPFGEAAFGDDIVTDDAEIKEPHARIYLPNPYDDEAPAQPTTAPTETPGATAPTVVPNSTASVITLMSNVTIGIVPPKQPSTAVSLHEDFAHVPFVAVADVIEYGLFKADTNAEAAPPPKSDMKLQYVITGAAYKKNYGGANTPPSANDGFAWRFNNQSWLDPTVPLYLSKGKYGIVTEYKNYGTRVDDVPYGAVVDLVVINNGAGSVGEFHTMHLHGHRFWVLGTGKLPYDEERAYATINLVDPPLKDTLPVRTGTYSILRIVADNPGMWHFHCHLTVHMMLGLQAAINVGQDSQPFPPDEYFGASSFAQSICPK